MSPHRLLALMLALLALQVITGCRQGPRAQAVHKESYERELRQLEEVNFELGLKIEDLQHQVAQLRSDTRTSPLPAGQRRADPLPDPPRPPAEDRPRRRDDDRRGPPDLDFPAPRNGPPEVEVPPLELPEIRPPHPDVPDAGGEAPLFDPSAGLRPLAPPASAGLLRPAAAEVPAEPTMQLVFHDALTRGLDLDGRPGDEGLRLVVTLVDAAGQPLRVPVRLAVAVVDPQLPKQHARLAFWEFTPEQSFEAFGSTPFGEGYFFELLWQRVAPANPKIEIHVRAITPGGQELRAVKPLVIAVTRR